MDKREATLEDLALQSQFVLDLQGGNREAAEKDSQRTKVMRRNIMILKMRGKLHRAMAYPDDDTPSSSDKNGSSLQGSLAQVVNQVVSVSSSKQYEPDSSCMESGTYC